MSHTPGPWTHTKAGRVVGPEGNTIADCRYKNGANDGPLIAAAPELLDCLLAFLDMGGHAADSSEDAITIRRSRAAIAKAKGGVE